MEVEFYTTKKGDTPVADFLRSLNEKLEAKTVRTIDLLKEFGTDLREPNSKPLGDGIFELRTKHGKDLTRVLYFFVHEGRAIITHGFIKKSQKTPPGEIETAKEYRKEYLSRE